MTCKHLQLRVCHNSAAPSNGMGVMPIVCARCDHYDGPSRGLGDTVHTVLTATGVTAVVKKLSNNCGCAGRRATLNEKFPTTANAPLDAEPKKS